MGRELILGVRPSDLMLADEGEAAIYGMVDGMEPLGDANLVYVRVGEQIIVFKYTGERTEFHGRIACARSWTSCISLTSRRKCASTTDPARSRPSHTRRALSA